MIGKILHIEESEQSEGLANKFPNTFRGSRGSRSNCSQFSPHLNLGTVFPVIKLTQICYINMNISFSLTLRT